MGRRKGGRSEEDVSDHRGGGGRLHTEGRCFSMCEPDDLLLREDRLMKPVVAHDGIKPTRYDVHTTVCCTLCSTVFLWRQTKLSHFDSFDI